MSRDLTVGTFTARDRGREEEVMTFLLLLLPLLVILDDGTPFGH